MWLAAGVREGEVVDRKYRIDQVLGVGGMGVVVAAQHLRLASGVALKFLLPSALENHEAVARFAEEARVLSAIRSEHVVTVFDVGELPNGAPYMVMEYLEGEDLASRVRKGGALPVEETVGFVLQACVAVAEAHRIAVVHRDLKPSNLFCIRASDGEVLIKLLDFGISKNVARVASGEMGSMTQTNAVMGTPLYMSPEQLRNAKDVDGRADLWALGAILFELLTGRPPFVGSTVTELTVNIMTTPTPRLSSYRPDAPNGLQAIIDRCLEKDRAVRIGSVAELAVALLPFGSPNARTPVKRISAILLRGAENHRRPSPWHRVPRARRRRSRMGRCRRGRVRRERAGEATPSFEQRLSWALRWSSSSRSGGSSCLFGRGFVRARDATVKLPPSSRQVPLRRKSSSRRRAPQGPSHRSAHRSQRLPLLRSVKVTKRVVVATCRNPAETEAGSRGPSRKAHAGPSAPRA